ncbi:MBL fold metallo-hydrolase [Longitalea arenae]|uniref:MBL fold metallo-hydrolase n=1 Tax=Longitalea arenae TaxID=2812558 RepID=UPI0019676B5C|nr:MBL fold metallo-hydrolase [Longitalea arenae]
MYTTNSISRKAGFHRFGLGTLELTVVSDGFIVFDPPQPILAPETSKACFKSALESHFLPSGFVKIALNMLVIKNGAQVILIDAGAGNTMGDSSGWLIPNLELAGIRPAEVTNILITHAHSDHIGGILTSTGDLAFPNAKVYMPRNEYEFWDSGTVNLSKSKLVDKEGFIRFSVPIIQAVKKALGAKLILFEPGQILFDFIKAIPTPGHTPGHTSYLIMSEGQELIHMGDLTHHLLLFEYPDWGFEADYDFKEGIVTRKEMLHRLAETRQLAFSIHLPWPGLGHVRKKGGAFEWVSEHFTSFSAM